MSVMRTFALFLLVVLAGTASAHTTAGLGRRRHGRLRRPGRPHLPPLHARPAARPARRRGLLRPRCRHPLDARHVFINNNSNGTPAEDGHSWQLRLDLTAPRRPRRHGAGQPRLRRAQGLLHRHLRLRRRQRELRRHRSSLGRRPGPRHGLRDRHRVDFTVGLGADYYFDSTLEGHDTSYSPDDDNVNPHEDYDWNSADDAINQPSLEIVGLIGVRWRLGD